MLDEDKLKRLNLLRYGLVTVTAVAFALGAALVFIGSGNTWNAILQGLLMSVGTGVLCLIVYFLYRSYLEKAS